MVLRPFWS